MTQTMTTQEKERVVASIKSTAAAARALADAVEELGEVPSGHLYASVMNVLSIDAYENCIRLLVDLGWVRKFGDLLIWQGRDAKVKEAA